MTWRSRGQAFVSSGEQPRAQVLLHIVLLWTAAPPRSAIRAARRKVVRMNGV